MWRKRPRNRRLGREFVLDVKLRSSQVRAARLRLAAVSLAVIFVAALGLYLAWYAGNWGLNRLLYENSAFAIERIDLETDGILKVSQLRRWSGVRLGQNLLALDLQHVTRNLAMISLVQTVSVERVLPHTLRIRVIEREPVAQLNVARLGPTGRIEIANFQLDGDGYVIAPVDPQFCAHPPSSPSEQLPLISGPVASEVQAGHRLDSPPLQAALQLIGAFEHSPMVGRADLKRIDASAADVLEVITGQGSEITFGFLGLDQQLRHWALIWDKGQELGKAVATLDLAVSNSVPLRLVDASMIPSVPVKPVRTSRKKHV